MYPATDKFNIGHTSNLIQRLIKYNAHHNGFTGKCTDWQDHIFRTAPVSNYQLSASGGNERTIYTASHGDFKQDGIVISS